MHITFATPKIGRWASTTLQPRELQFVLSDQTFPLKKIGNLWNGCILEETQNLPTLSSFGSHLARKGLSRCWSKQYFEWSQEAEASLKKVKEEDGQMEMLMPELSLVKEELRCIRGVFVLFKKAEMPDPWGRVWRRRNSETLANCRLSRFLWRENSRRSPVEEMRSANFSSKGIHL